MTVNTGTSFPASPADKTHKSSHSDINQFKALPGWLEGVDCDLPSSITFHTSPIINSGHTSGPEVPVLNSPEASLNSPEASLEEGSHHHHHFMPLVPRHSTSTVDGCNPDMDASYSESDGEDWQPQASYSETTEDSGDGFDHGTGGVHENEHTSLQTDDDSESQDMDEENPLYDVFCRRPVGYCLNCTQTLYSTACSACGHDSRSNDDLFSTARDVQPEPSTSAASSPDALIVWDEQMLLHEEGETAPHPERPNRLRAVIARLQASGLAERFKRVPSRQATEAELLTVHTRELVAQVAAVSSIAARNMAEGRPLYLQNDTYANPHTYTCARLSAGSCAEAAVRVARGEARFGAAIVRPPGHHAESNTAMGFCFFNNAAVAARAAQAAGAQRVIILDWDVHHGNGTQHIFEDDPSVLYMSLHRYDRGMFYPGTGAACEVGVGGGKGYTVNVPWNGSACDADYITAFSQVLLPIAYEYHPDLILVSAGFDAAKGDPIGGCSVSPACFAHMTSLLKAIAPLVVMLEGGYNLSATARSTEACLRVLLGEQPQPLQWQSSSTNMAKDVVLEVQRHHAAFWKSLPNLPSGYPHPHPRDIVAAFDGKSPKGLADALLPIVAGGWGDETGEALGKPPGAQPVRSAAGAGDRERVDHRAAASCSESGAGEERVVRVTAAAHAAGAGHKGARHRPLKRPLHHARKMQILRAVHNSAVRAFRRRCNRGTRASGGKVGL